MYKFEIYQDKAGEYRFRFKASNGETMFSSEGYKAKASAIHAIESIKRNSAGADTVDLTTMTAGAPPLRENSKRFACHK